jgi:hypothetical protein
MGRNSEGIGHRDIRATGSLFFQAKAPGRIANDISR